MANKSFLKVDDLDELESLSNADLEKVIGGNLPSSLEQTLKDLNERPAPGTRTPKLPKWKNPLF